MSVATIHSTATPRGRSVSFGPFRLFPTARAIEKDGIPLVIGSRALDVLIVLAERAGEVVSHRELTARVWRELVVSSSNLRVHIAGLRKALGDQEGFRYIANVPGQGYCFVAPIRQEDSPCFSASASLSCTGGPNRRCILPPALVRMVGRDGAVQEIAADLITHRFLTIVGPGGMGKTTVAVSVARTMTEEFALEVCFVDMGAIADPKLVAATIASTLGLAMQAEDTLPGLLQYLRQARLLLVLDNCEHVIEASATLAEQIFNEASSVHILATSREALRVEGEHAYCLSALQSPPPDCNLSAAEVLEYPAVELFVERAAAGGTRIELDDSNAPIVAGICRRLDGIALAIELAAGRVATYGIKGTADLLDRRRGIHWKGRRTSPPRHQTLHALLDWSYNLLSETERVVLRRLSIFVGEFTLEAARAVASTSKRQESDVFDSLDALVVRSLVSTTVTADGMAGYQLLETTRAFAIERLAQSGEADLIARRHATYFERLQATIAAADVGPCLEHRPPARREHLGNLRAALEWCFAERATEPAASNSVRVSDDAERVVELVRGNCNAAALGIRLAAASIPTLLDLSLFDECHKWSAVALARLDDTTRGGKAEMVLQEAWAITSTWTLGNGDDVRRAIVRGLEVARGLGEMRHVLRLLTALHTCLIRSAEYVDSLPLAEEVSSFAQSMGCETSLVMSDWAQGSSHHVMGN